MDASPDDNELVAAGAVLMLLLQAQKVAKSLAAVDVVTTADGAPTAQLDITFTFMRSPYRLTVQRAETP